MDKDKFIKAVRAAELTLKRAQLRFTINNTRAGDDWRDYYRGAESNGYWYVHFGAQPWGFWSTDSVKGSIRIEGSRKPHIDIGWGSGGRDSGEADDLVAANDHARAVKALALAIERALAILEN